MYVFICTYVLLVRIYASYFTYKYMHSITHMLALYMNAEVIGRVYKRMYKCISMCAG